MTISDSMNSFGVSGTGFTEDENQTLMLLRSNKERLQLEIQQIRQEITEVTSRINELQSEVDRNAEPKVWEAIELFNQGAFSQCFKRLLELDAFSSTPSGTLEEEVCKSTDVVECSAVDKANFLSANISNLNIEKFHKFLFKTDNQLVMRQFLLAVPIEGLSLVDSVRKCFKSLLFTEAESDVITRIYKYISQSYFIQNPEEAEKTFGSEDACEFAAGAIVFINTSLNNTNVKEKDKMTEDDFANFGQCREVREMTEDGSGISREYMVNVYRELKKNPLQLTSNYTLNMNHKSVLKQGFLFKEGGQYRNWKKRFFVLHSDFLYYYENPEHEKPKGIIVLQNLEVRATNDSSRKFCFELVDRGSSGSGGGGGSGSASSGGGGEKRPKVIKATKTQGGTHVEGKHSRYIMSASSEEERDEWIAAIKDTLKVDMVYALLQWREANKSQAPSAF